MAGEWQAGYAPWESDPQRPTWEGMQAGIQLGRSFMQAREQAMRLPIEIELLKTREKVQDAALQGQILDNELARQTIELDQKDRATTAEWLKQYPTVESRVNAPDPALSTPKWMQGVARIRQADSTSTYQKQLHDTVIAQQQNARSMATLNAAKARSSDRFWQDVSKNPFLDANDIDDLQATADESGLATQETRRLYAEKTAIKREAEKSRVETFAGSHGMEPIKVSPTGQVTYGKPTKEYLTFPDGSILMKSGPDLVRVNTQTGESTVLYKPDEKGRFHERDMANLLKARDEFAPGTWEREWFVDEIGKLKLSATAKAAAPPVAGAPQIPPTIKTKAEFDALSSGTIYIGTDGKKYRKP